VSVLEEIFGKVMKALKRRVKLWI